MVVYVKMISNLVARSVVGNRRFMVDDSESERSTYSTNVTSVIRLFACLSSIQHLMSYIEMGLGYKNLIKWDTTFHELHRNGPGI